ncbi:hypothetical protein PENTCL1PPCAC_30794, partial [Pristionchus entomophagus]
CRAVSSSSFSSRRSLPQPTSTSATVTRWRATCSSSGGTALRSRSPNCGRTSRSASRRREQCYILRDCKDDSKCLGELKYEPTSVET